MFCLTLRKRKGWIMITSANTSKGISYYWDELKNLSNDEKLQIIMLLSSSMRKKEEDKEKSSHYTKKMLSRFSGAWVGEESPEEIIQNINSSKAVS
jgi:flagellar motor switch protein FliG